MWLRNHMKDQQNCVHINRGYIALTSVLVVGVVLLTIGLSVSLIAISEGQLSLSARRNESALDLTEACVEYALLELSNTNSVDTTVTLPEGTCSLVVNSTVGTTWTFTVTGTKETLTKKIQVNAVRGSAVSVTSWLEIP
jgi:Tfp pilus assembly protein PilX